MYPPNTRSTASASPAPPPAGSANANAANNLWNGGASTAGGAASQQGFQLPGGKGVAGAGAAGPSRASRQPSIEAPEEEKATDVDALMDAVGISGVDIGAEEEGMRLANERIAPPPTGPAIPDRSRKQDFIDPQVLADVVKKIAAAFQLRTLEPDTIPLIALAARHRLLSIITAAIAARDHRLAASHLRPPPTKRARAPSSDDELDPFEERRRAKGKGPAEDSEDGPAWDILVLDEQEKLLGALERVDREEERRNRRERMVREQKEQDDRDLAEAVAASAAAELEREAEKGRGDDKLLMGGAGGGGGSGTSTPKGKGKAEGGEGGTKKKEKKEKKGQMSEDVRKRLTDQVAMRSIGGRSFSWLNSAGGSPAPSTPTPGGLPKPKFTPGAPALPPPSFSPSPAHFNNASLLNGSSNLSRASYTASSLDRLGVPLSHDANLARTAQMEWQEGAKIVERGDLVWALERERGMGTGRGKGRDTLVRNGAGIIGRFGKQ